MNDLCAVIDLGSNSFRLLLAEQRNGGELLVHELIKEKVQLLSGFKNGRLARAAVDRGLDCLDRFAQRTAAVSARRIWVIGTHALRTARNASEVAKAVRAKLGVTLQLVSGEEEASLIFGGVAHYCSASPRACKLVVDIGGGSTELAWGKGLRCTQPHSAPVGCVGLTDAYFSARQGDVAEAMRRARAHARTVLDDALPNGSLPAAEVVLGTSGTIESVQSVLSANGWDGESITAAGLGRLRAVLESGCWVPDLVMPGLRPERVDIFPAGVALLDAIFDKLGLPTMHYLPASIQDGVLYRNVARTLASDPR